MANALRKEIQMKTAIYIEDGVTQVVLTPESEFEKFALSELENQSLNVQIFNGTFYDCRGGWIRQREDYRSSYPTLGQTEDKSIIIRTDDKENKNDI